MPELNERVSDERMAEMPERLRDMFAKTMPSNWAEVLESRAAASHLDDTMGTVDLLRATAVYLRQQLRASVVMPDQKWVDNLAARISVDVCEIERDSPEDDPTACIVYAPEIDAIVVRRVTEALAALSAGGAPDWSSSKEREAAKAGEAAAFAYSKTGGGPIGVFLEGLRAYRAALSVSHETGDGETQAPSFWAVWSVSGAHVGTWSDQRIAERVYRDEYPNGDLKALYASPLPAPTDETQGVKREPVGYVSDATLAYLELRVSDVRCHIYGTPVSIHNEPLFSLSQLEAVERERDEARERIGRQQDEITNLSDIIDSGVDDIAGAKLDDLEANLAAANQIVGQVEERFPSWRSYRDLIDCIDATMGEKP